MTKILLFFTILLANCCLSQSLDCKVARTGKFELPSAELGTTVILRTKTTQTEINEKGNFKAEYSIRWVDDCTYELRNKKLISGSQQDYGKDSDVLTVEIIKIEGSDVTVRISVNFADGVFEATMQKVK